jgi:hypothetical protein
VPTFSLGWAARPRPSPGAGKGCIPPQALLGPDRPRIAEDEHPSAIAREVPRHRPALMSVTTSLHVNEDGTELFDDVPGLRRPLRKRDKIALLQDDRLT